MYRLLAFGLAIALLTSAADAQAQSQTPYGPYAPNNVPGKPGPAVRQPAPGQLTPALTPTTPGPGARSAARLPWEREGDRLFRQPADPADQAVKKLYEDPMAKLGLPPNKSPTGGGSSQAAPTVPPPPEFSRLDANRDGAVSQREYATGRARAVPNTAGGPPSMREQSLNQRSNARFRQADRDRDGTVTPEEYSRSRNARF